MSSYPGREVTPPSVSGGKGEVAAPSLGCWPQQHLPYWPGGQPEDGAARAQHAAPPYGYYGDNTASTAHHGNTLPSFLTSVSLSF